MTAFITGTGKTKFGVLSDSLPQLLQKAVDECLENAGRTIDDVDAVYLANFLGGPQESQLHLNALFSSVYGFEKPALRIETACASGAVALNQGIAALQRFDRVLVVGVEKLSGTDSKTASSSIALAGSRALDQQNGIIFPAAYALLAQQHFLRYGSSIDDLTLISLKNHSNANHNPKAHFYSKHVTREMIEQSPLVATPLRLYDCSPISDGAAAVLLEKDAGRARARVRASQLRTDTISLVERGELTSLKAVRQAAAAAYAEAGITPREIDVAEIHDCFTMAELIAYEDLGFAPAGEGKRLVRNHATELNGELPVNTDGGLKADGHPIGASGVAQAVELTLQLSGEAGKRQVDGAKIGLCHNVGGIGGTAAIHVLEEVE